jgi:hypothetical protein
MRIAELTNEPLNYEAARVENLIPMQLRGDAAKFIEFMEDYYTFMNQYESPSQIISKANEQHDLDQIEEKYLEDIQSLLAPYIPFNLYGNVIKDKKRFFRLLVRYFYTSRGSRQSIHDFFRIFFNEEVEIIENIDRTILLGGSDLVPGDSQSMMDQWGPYSYGIGTAVPVGNWYVPYKALVHPIGWRFFAYVVMILNSENIWNTVAPDTQNWDYDSLNTFSWHKFPPGGAHLPTIQASAAFINRWTLDLTNDPEVLVDINTRLAYGLRFAELILTFGPQENVSHMTLTKIDYVRSLKTFDQTPAGLHKDLTFASTTQPFSYDFVNDFINVSSEVIIRTV